MIVAIDGPSGTGKSTVAQKVTERLGFVYFNTGAMYRSFAVFVLEKGVDPEDVNALVALLDSFTFDIRKVNNEDRYYVNNRDVTDLLYQEKISKLSSFISAYKEVRCHLLPIQREFAKKHDAVFEGRDIGTVVFPNADLKIFLTARPEVRAKRRTDQLKEKYPNEFHDFNHILEEIKARDTRDSSRSIAPLKQAEDAVVVDTSDMSIEEVIDTIVGLVP